MKQKGIVKRIIALSMVCIMVFLSMDAGSITALATDLQEMRKSVVYQTPTGAFDLDRDIPRLDSETVDFSGLSIDKVTELPKEYDSRDLGYVTSIKDQYPWGTCWAFAACAAMESYALSHGLVDSPEKVNFSEYALAYFTYKDDLYYDQTGDKTITEDLDIGFNAGGNDEYAFKTLSKWAGVYNEGSKGYYENSNTYSDGTSNPNGEMPAFDVNSATCDFVFTGQKYISMEDPEQVKVAIMENGAVTASYYHSRAYSNDGTSGEYYFYNYNYEKYGTNHAITIVGWDDDIDKKLFTILDAENNPHTPDNNGAWLVKNSWGEGIGEDGYIWISYEDIAINLYDAVVYEIAPKSLYDNVYQHDGATVFGVGMSSTKFASVYEIAGENIEDGQSQETTKQLIQAVSFAVGAVTNIAYTVNIYKNTEGAVLDSGELVATKTGKTSYEGYYTVVLDNPVLVSPGETYTVELCFDKNAYVIMGYDGYRLGDGGIASTSCSSSDNESYIYYRNEYVSLYDEDQAYHNLCIKMFTTDVVDYETPQITNVEMVSLHKAGISWQKMEGAVGYKLYIEELNQDADSTVNEYIYLNIDGVHTTYREVDAKLGKDYVYRVRALYPDEGYSEETGGDVIYSEYSPNVYFKAEIPAVELAVFVEANNVTLNWNVINFVDGYRIYRSIGAGDFELVSDIPASESDDGQVNSMSYQDEALGYGYEYTYYVISYVVQENADSTDTVDITSHLSNIEKVLVQVPTVNNFKVKEYFYEKLLFSWDSLGDIVDGYEIDIYKVMRDDYYQWSEYLTTIEVENGTADAYTYTYNAEELEPGTEIFVEIYAYINVGDDRAYSIENSSVYDYYYIPDKALDVDVEWYVKNQNGTNYIALLLEEATKDALYIRYYDDLDRENPLRAYVIDLTNQKALTLYSEYDIPYGTSGYLYITDMYNTTAYQETPYAIGGAYAKPELDTIADVVVTEAGQVVTLEAKIKNPMDNFNYRYQWYMASDATSEGTAIEGATESAYDVSIGSYEKKYYYCEITVEYGEVKTFRTTNEKGENSCVIGEGYNSSIEVEYEQEYVYSGKEIIPEIVVKDRDVVLKEGVDYDVVYSDNKNAGEAVGTITFKGTYQDQKSTIIKFTILPKTSDKLTLPTISSVEFTGKEIKPEVVIKDGDVVLIENVDYTVEYDNNINAGYAVITLKFIGNYKGTENIIFEVKQKSAENVVYNYSLKESYTGEEVKPEVVIVDGDYTLILGTDYQLSYEHNKNAGTAKINVSFKKNYFGEKELTFEISPRDAQFLTIGEIEKREYTGYAIVPNLDVKFGDITLTKNTDYKVVCTNNTALGTANVTLTFEGNYTGTLTTTFQIVERTAENLIYGAIANQTYTGASLRPDVSIKNGDIPLKNTIDYDISYKDNVNAGTATATVVFKGNYAGTKSLNFTIDPKSGKDCTVTDIPDVTYTGSAIEPDVEVKDGDRVLEKGKDYSVGYHKNINAGEAVVTIVFGGNYTGSISSTFIIKPLEVTDAVISKIANQVYIGEAITPEIQVTSGELQYEKDVDYTIEATNNIYVGKATLLVTFTGNYSGTVETTFDIIPRNTANVVISAIDEQRYTGSEIKPELTIKDGTIVLVKGQDYTVEYQNNINKGTATVIVSFIGNFTGDPMMVNFIIGDSIPTTITSTYVTISESSGYMSKISVGTTVSTLLSYLNEKNYVSIFDKNGNTLSNEKVLGTGMTAGIVDEGTVVKRYTVIVTGDVTGDGELSGKDMISIKAHVLNKVPLQGCYEKAGDVTGDGIISGKDFIKTKATILNKDTITGVSVN